MNMKNNTKAGLFFGLGMSFFLAIKGFITSDVLTNHEISKIITASLIGGGAGGFIYGLVIGKFGLSKFINKSIKFELKKDEKLIFQTPANHFKGIESVGGKLFLTDKSLFFKSHRLNIQNHELTIDIINIVRVERFNTIGFIKNGLLIETNLHAKEKFVVEKREECIANIDKIRKQV